MTKDLRSARLKEVLCLSIDAVPVDASESYQIAGVYSFGRGLLSRAPISGSETTYKSLNRLRKDDFVLSQLKGWEGALAKVPAFYDGWFLSPQFPTFRAIPDKLDIAYLDWYCKQSKVWDELRSTARGMGARRDSVSPERFLSLEIPLPTLSEQRRIVARIEELAAKINEASALRGQAAEETDALSHSVVEALFRRLCDKIGTTTLDDICHTITDGDHNTPIFSDEGIRFIFVGNVSSARLHFENSKRVSPDYFKTLKPQRLPQRGDILYSAVGATLGIPAIVDTDEPFCFQRHVAILKPDHERVESRFIWHMLRSRTVFEKAWSSTTGSAQPTIPLRAIRELPVPVPLLAEQLRIVDELDALKAQVDALKKLQGGTAAELDALLLSILAEAFKGEL